MQSLAPVEFFFFFFSFWNLQNQSAVGNVIQLKMKKYVQRTYAHWPGINCSGVGRGGGG